MRMVRDQMEDIEKDPNQTFRDGKTVSESRNKLNGIKSKLHITVEKKE